jgi:hypothetical protein
MANVARPGRARAVAYAGALALLAATIGLLILSEPTSARLLFAVAVTAAIAAGFLLLSSRPLFASVATFCLVIFIFAVSSEKRAMMNMALHSYDIAFYLNAETLGFLWKNYRTYVASGLALLGALILAAALAWRFDPTRWPRLVACVALLLAVAGAIELEPQETVNASGFQMFNEGSLISSFYMSWGETVRTLRRGQLLKAASTTSLPDFVPMTKCSPDRRPPHILLIHQESLVPLSLFSSLDYDRGLDAFFLSSDQKLHKLGVETYGGASWITEFALLSGVSTKAFGGMRPFVQVFMQGRLKETLPQILQTCGYRTLMLFPMKKGFLSLDKFYQSIGFSEVLDQTAQGAPSAQERDRFYFQNALEAMDRHFQSSTQPLFLYVQTMAAHGPYDKRYMPEEHVPEGGPGTSDEMNEYLRRVAMARQDEEFLVAEIKRRFPNEPVLIVRYGDHQPIATLPLLQRARADHRAGILKGPVPDAFVTFYAMTGNDFIVPPLPEYDVLDVAYLSTAILQVAGLPLSEAQQDRKRLMATCEGQFFDCKQRDQILVFNRRLINSGLIQSQ